MAAPTIKVEIGFQGTPLEVDPVWTDVTPWLKSEGGQRGRTFELDKVQTGERTLTFDNSDGRFTPGRLASPVPFRDNIKPRRPVRVTVTLSGTVYGRFRGYTDEWDTQAPGGGAYAEATVTVVDGFDWLSKVKLTTPYRCEVLLSSPKGYYPLTNEGRIINDAAFGNLSKHHEGPLYAGFYRGDNPPPGAS